MSQTTPTIFLGHGNPMNALLRTFPVEGVDGGSISMLAAQFGK